MRNPLIDHIDKVIATEHDAGRTSKQIQHRRLARTVAIGLLGAGAASAIGVGVAEAVDQRNTPNCVLPITEKGVIDTADQVGAGTDRVLRGITADGQTFNAFSDPLHAPSGAKVELAQIDPATCISVGGVAVNHS